MVQCKMLFSLPLLLSAIFGNLIDLNGYTTALSIKVNSAVPTAAKGLYDTRKDSEDLKNIDVAAVLTKPFSCVGIINHESDLFEANENGENVADIGYLLSGEHLDNRCKSSQLKIEQHNVTHFVSQIVWTIYDKTLTVDNIKVFLSTEDHYDDPSIRKSRLDLACSYDNADRVKMENGILQFDCYAKSQLIENLLYTAKGEGLIVSAVKFVGRKDPLYQVARVALHESVKQISTFHGYVSEPRSRAVLCQHRVNKKCGLIIYEPQSVEGFKNFPHGPHSPPDGKIASGNNPHFKELDEYGEDRWVRTQFPTVSCLNETHVSFNISWMLTASHASENIHVYISNENYTSSEPFSRRHLDLQPLCTLEFYGRRPPAQLTLFCPISLEKYRRASEQKELLLLSVWNVYDTSFAFYQVMDLQALSEEQSYKSVLQKCRYRAGK